MSETKEGGWGSDPGVQIRSVYVHAPFCPKRCHYCDFAVTVAQGEGVKEWLKAVKGELSLLADAGGLLLDQRLDTLFVGGGTPSLLGPSAMAGLADALGPARLDNPDLEWTAEANPESFTPEVARAWLQSGLNRVSLGVQSFQEEPLRWMGRGHGVTGARRAIDVAREAGIRNLSIDLIFGLPDSVPRDWSLDLEMALSLEMPHLSLYGLTVESGTPLDRAVQRGTTLPADEDRYREEYLEASESLSRAGYVHYEVSNFALPGFESRHNQVYWELRPYLGLGNSAHSFLPPVRRWNLRDWREYQDAVRRKRIPTGDEERLSPQAEKLERIWLGLRTSRGIPLGDLSPAGLSLGESWKGKGLAIQTADRLRLTPQGWLLLDRLALELDEAEDSIPASHFPRSS